MEYQENLNPTVSNNDSLSVYGSQFDYSSLPKGSLIMGILINLTGMVLQCFVIMYERFNMDPMKRGLINQLITTYMLYAMSLSILAIIRWLSVLLFPTWPRVFHQVFGWLRYASHIGCLLAMGEIMLFMYWSKMWLKRVPSYDHVFLGFWLNVANAVHSLYFGGLQAYCQSQWAKDEDGYTGPRLKIVAILGFALTILSVVYMTHKVFDWFKTRATQLRKNIKIHPIINQVTDKTAIDFDAGNGIELHDMAQSKEGKQAEVSVESEGQSSRRKKGEPKAVFLERLQKYQHQEEQPNTNTMFVVAIGPQESQAPNTPMPEGIQLGQRQPLAIMLNTMKFNPDLMSWPIIFAVSILLLIHVYLLSATKEALFSVLFSILKSFFIPLLFCTFNQRLRSYIWSQFSKN